MDNKNKTSSRIVPHKYEQCRKETGDCEKSSNLSKGRRTITVVQSLSGQPCEAISKKMDTRLFTLDDSFSKIYTKLDDSFKTRTNDLSALMAYEKFEKFVRPHGMFVSDFLEEFEKLKKQVEDYEIFLPEKVLAYRVLKSANLTEEREKYVKTRVSEFTFTAVSVLLRKIMKSARPEAKGKNNNASQNVPKNKKANIAVVSEKKEDISVNAESRRNQLMRDMAQLRLQAEVSQLEGSLESDQPIFPPYLVAHTSALCDALPSLKQLTQTARCIVIIPQAVIDILDFLKKSTAKAREAIRWLELEFRHGNRYIRAQKCNERLSGAGDSSLKKTNKDLWCLVEIVDCCRYLAQQSGDFSHSGVTTVLISNDPNTWDGAHFIKDMQQKGQCQDISFENINQFMNKWKVMWKSKG